MRGRRKLGSLPDVPVDEVVLVFTEEFQMSDGTRIAQVCLIALQLVALGPVWAIGRPEADFLQACYIATTALIGAGLMLCWVLSRLARRYAGLGWKFILLTPLLILALSQGGLGIFIWYARIPVERYPSISLYNCLVLLLVLLVFFAIKEPRPRISVDAEGARNVG